MFSLANIICINCLIAVVICCKKNESSMIFFCISGGVNSNALRTHNLLPSLIHIMDKNDENNRSIGRVKWHNIVGIFCSIWARKSELGLGSFCDLNLVITGRRTQKPIPTRATEGNTHCIITVRNRVYNDSCDRIEGNIINVKSPEKVISITNVFLLWLRHQQAFREPFAIGYLTNFL